MPVTFHLVSLLLKDAHQIVASLNRLKSIDIDYIIKLYDFRGFHYKQGGLTDCDHEGRS